MSKKTTNYQFVMPELTDSPPDITVTNSNWEKIDTELKAHDDEITESANLISSNLTKGNLLHNWDFRNPVNQRALSSYTTQSSYTIDRWKIEVANLTVQSNNIRLSPKGISVNFSLGQTLENPSKLIGLTLTVSAIIDAYSAGSAPFYLGFSYADESGGHFMPLTIITGAGTFSGTWTVPAGVTRLTTIATSQSTTGYIDISRIKLELGSVSTLANDPPVDYGEQLALCQRFYYRHNASNAWYIFAVGQIISTTQASIPIPFPVTMRIAPTVTTVGNFGASNSGDATLAVLSKSFESSPDRGLINVSVDSGLVAGNATRLRANDDTTAYIEFSSDL